MSAAATVIEGSYSPSSPTGAEDGPDPGHRSGRESHEGNVNRRQCARYVTELFSVR